MRPLVSVILGDSVISQIVCTIVVHVPIAMAYLHAFRARAEERKGNKRVNVEVPLSRSSL